MNEMGQQIIKNISDFTSAHSPLVRFDALRALYQSYRKNECLNGEINKPYHSKRPFFTYNTGSKTKSSPNKVRYAGSVGKWRT